MRLKITNFLLLIFVFSFLIFPLIASAVDYLPLVPCGLKTQPTDGDPNWNYTHACNRCDTFRLIDNVIHLVIEGIVPPVAAVLFIVGGLMIVLAGANPKWIETGKNIFWNTFIGLVVIFSSWIIVNTFIQSFGPDQARDNWFRFTCRDSVITGPGGISLPPGAACSDPQGLAQVFNTSPTVKNAPELDQLISCVNSRLSGSIDQNQVYTYEQNNNICNYTRGRPVCGSCAHTINSCHYGGPDGTNGSLAVDFNARGISEQDLFNRLNALYTGGNVCNFGFIQFEGDHTHVSTRSCSADTGDR